MEPMKVVIAGGTGFLGRPLADALRGDGHHVTLLTRQSTPTAPPGMRAVHWTPDGSTGAWAAELDGAGAANNLAGESIAGHRWTAAQKRRILDSRVQATRSLAQAIARAVVPPPVFVSGSAVGYYGPRGDDVVTEDTPAGTDFLAGVAVQWETEAMRAARDSTRIVWVRTGLVLDRDGGALPQMLPPFRLGLGGRLGSGRQYWPWIHRQDWIDLVRFALETPDAKGPINATAPHPVTNADFTQALARALKRPALVPAPAFALRLLLGEMADALLLSGQRAVPAKAERLGFTFTFKHLDDALRAIFEG
jgi:uncharacterized protein (TIGR01777 family)